jgi:catechol 2,3-dioxygenase-like lactoylglutathione lyase family enzyme
MKIDSLDHLVLTVKDIDVTVSFYSGLLGMDVVTFADGRTALSFGAEKSQTFAEQSSRLRSPRLATATRSVLAYRQIFVLLPELR